MQSRKPTLLSSESESEFASLRAEIENEIKPKGAIEQIFVDDITAITWEILRVRRNKTGIIRNTFPAALQSILKLLLHREDYLHNVAIEDPIIEASLNYFCDRKTEKMILGVLRRFGLDHFSIEAEAFRLAASELEKFDKMLSNSERRRYKAIKFIAQYRQSLAIQIRQVTDRIIAEADVPRLEPSTSLDHGE